MSKSLSTGLLILALAAVGFALLAPVMQVMAAEAGTGTGGTGGNAGTGTGATDPSGPPANAIDTPDKVIKVLEKITNWMFTIFIALAAMMIIYAAFIYLTSGGGEDVSKAHKMLLYAAVAIIVATASRGLVALTRTFITTP